MRPTCPSLLDHAAVPALLVTDLTNIRYITGLTLSAGVVLAAGRQYQLFVSPLYLEEARANVRAGVQVRPAHSLPQAMQKLPIIAFEEESVTVQQIRSWQQKNKSTKFVRSSGILAAYRRQKDARELQLIRRAHRITREMLRRVPAALRTGVTEREIAWKLTSWAHELGADGLSFAPIVAFGTHTARPHHHPSSRTLQKGHLVQIDVGAVYRGYCADLAQVYFTAPPTDQQTAMLAAIQHAMKMTKALIAPGADGAMIDESVRSFLASKGFKHGYPHALGHGVGLSVHDPGVLSMKRGRNEILQHEVYAIEPAIYIEGTLGMRLEEMIVVQ